MVMKTEMDDGLCNGLFTSSVRTLWWRFEQASI
jgi:hypothetical protein